MPVDHPSITIQPQAIWLWLDQLIREVLCGVRSCLSCGTEGHSMQGYSSLVELVRTMSMHSREEVSRLCRGSSSRRLCQN